MPRAPRKGARIALACALLFVFGATGAQAQPLATGVAGVEGVDSAVFRHTAETGASFVHVGVGWSAVAPQDEPGDWHPEDPADPHYDWSSIDLRVLGIVEAGLTPLLQIDGAPAWAQRCRAPSPLEGRLCDPDPVALAAFSTAAARRYSGLFQGLPRVRFWQGLNEPNLSLFFNPQFKNGRPVSPGLYRTLINSFYAAVKGVKRSNVVLAAGLGPIARPGSTVGPMRFARMLLCMAGRRNPRPVAGNCGGGVYFDVFDIHPYTTGGPTHQGGADDVQLGDLEKLQELLAAADRAGRINGMFRRTPLWITEFSWDSKPPDPGGLLMSIQARWIAHALYAAWDAGISKFFWYGLRDQARSSLPFNESLQSGLYFRGPTPDRDRPKKAMYAFRFPFVAFPDENGFGFWGRTPTSAAGSVAIQVQERGRWRTASVAHANAAGIFEGRVDTTYGESGRGFVRARFGGETAVPFSLREVADFYQPPFG